MSRGRRWTQIVALAGALALLACSDDSSPLPADARAFDLGTGPDHGRLDTGLPDTGLPDTGPPDAAPPDGPAITVINETEPNNGGSATEYNTITVPTQIKGAVGQADDLDLFGFSAAAGERFTITLASDGALQPHLAVFDPQNKLPPVVSIGAKDVLAEHYALKSQVFLIGVRDRRNVPSSSSQHVGGAAFTYTVTITPLTRAPISITVGGQQSASLSPAGTVRVFEFSAQKDDDLQIAVQVPPPADIDARLSLFSVTNKSWHGTNESPTGLDALLKGPMPLTGTYHAIVDSVSETATGFDFTLKITKP